MSKVQSYYVWQNSYGEDISPIFKTLEELNEWGEKFAAEDDRRVQVAGDSPYDSASAI